MTQENKELLLKDLCARLPYNVVINCTEEDDERTNFNCFLAPDMIKDIESKTAYWIIKPYLRPMSSMTEEEKNIYEYNRNSNVEVVRTALFDWLNEHHFDYRGLIEKGLALEAPEEIYNIKEE